MITFNDIAQKYIRVFGKKVEVKFNSQEVEVPITKVYKCDDCQDTGEEINYHFDDDSKQTYVDGTRPCHCTL